MADHNALVITFTDRSKSYEAYSTLKQLAVEDRLVLRGAQLVTRSDDGHLNLPEGVDTDAGSGTWGGGLIGLIIGIRNAIITKKRKHLYEKCGMLMMIVALIVLVTTLAGFLPEVAMYPAIALVIVALPLILLGAGIFGTIEVMSTVGNILSYARLMAIGMASVPLTPRAAAMARYFSPVKSAL